MFTLAINPTYATKTKVVAHLKLMHHHLDPVYMETFYMEFTFALYPLLFSFV